MKERHHSKGFTLVELMISMAILSVVAIITYRLLSSVVNQYNKDNQDIRLQTEVEEILTLMEDLVMDADTVQILDGGKQLQVFQRIEGAPYYFLVYVEGNNIYYQQYHDTEAGGTAGRGRVYLGTYVKSVSFTLSENATAVFVDMQMENGGASYAASRKILLRNLTADHENVASRPAPPTSKPEVPLPVETDPPETTTRVETLPETTTTEAEEEDDGPVEDPVDLPEWVCYNITDTTTFAYEYIGSNATAVLPDSYVGYWTTKKPSGYKENKKGQIAKGQYRAMHDPARPLNLLTGTIYYVHDGIRRTVVCFGRPDTYYAGLELVSDQYYIYTTTTIKTLILPTSLQSLAPKAMRSRLVGHYWEKLETVVFSPGCTVQEIPARFFQDCDSLKQVTTSQSQVGNGVNTLPGTVKIIGEEAFEGLVNLTGTMNLATVRTIGKQAFQNCKKLTALQMGGVEDINGNDASVLKTIGKESFKNCTGVNTTVVIPSSVEYIGDSAFASFGASVEKDLIIKANLKDYSTDAAQAAGGGSQQVAGDLGNKAQTAIFDSMNFTGRVVIGGNITSIGQYQTADLLQTEGVFRKSKFTTVVWSDRLTALGRGAFGDMTNLKKSTILHWTGSQYNYLLDNGTPVYANGVILPSSVQAIGDANVVSGAKSLAYLFVPDNHPSYKNMYTYGGLSNAVMFIPADVEKYPSGFLLDAGEQPKSYVRHADVKDGTDTVEGHKTYWQEIEKFLTFQGERCPCGQSVTLEISQNYVETDWNTMTAKFTIRNSGAEVIDFRKVEILYFYKLNKDALGIITGPQCNPYGIPGLGYFDSGWNKKIEVFKGAEVSDVASGVLRFRNTREISMPPGSSMDISTKMYALSWSGLNTNGLNKSYSASGNEHIVLLYNGERVWGEYPSGVTSIVPEEIEDPNDPGTGGNTSGQALQPMNDNRVRLQLENPSSWGGWTELKLHVYKQAGDVDLKNLTVTQYVYVEETAGADYTYRVSATWNNSPNATITQGVAAKGVDINGVKYTKLFIKCSNISSDGNDYYYMGQQQVVGCSQTPKYHCYEITENGKVVLREGVNYN